MNIENINQKKFWIATYICFNLLVFLFTFVKTRVHCLSKADISENMYMKTLHSLPKLMSLKNFFQISIAWLSNAAISIVDS